MSPSYRTALRALVAVLLIYSGLVLFHDGEFWPFSIYPMFSQGGHPWARAIVRDVSDEPDVPRWGPVSLDELPGRTYPLGTGGLNQNDLANFVSKADDWNARRIGAMRKVFGDALNQHALLVLRADGHLNERDSVVVQYTPFILLTPDTTRFNPEIGLRMD